LQQALDGVIERLERPRIFAPQVDIEPGRLRDAIEARPASDFDDGVRGAWCVVCGDASDLLDGAADGMGRVRDSVGSP
jgi:hypothetical protein